MEKLLRGVSSSLESPIPYYSVTNDTKTLQFSEAARRNPPHSGYQRPCRRMPIYLAATIPTLFKANQTTCRRSPFYTSTL